MCRLSQAWHRRGHCRCRPVAVGEPARGIVPHTPNHPQATPLCIPHAPFPRRPSSRHPPPTPPTPPLTPASRLCCRVLLVATGILSISLARRAAPAGQVGAGEPAATPPQLARLGVEPWHKAGVRGAGVKVAIIDSGFRGYHDRLGKDLPARIVARSFHFDGNLEARDSNHGVLCGEVIHAIAPDAELLFANWEPDHPETFVEAVKWCRREGARCISCSVIVPAWGDGEGGGAIHKELAKIVGAGGQPGHLLAVACA